MNVLIKIWLWLSILLPAAFGLLFLFNPKMPVESTGAVGLAYMVGIRQLVFAAVLAFAALRLPTATIALLLAGRGLTDVADGIATLATSGFSPMAISPIVGAIITFLVAYAFWRRAARAPAAAPAVG